MVKKKKKMKDKRNEEFLEQITALMHQYDDLGIVADSYLIGGQRIDYIELEKKSSPSSLSLFCSGFVNTKIVDSDPNVLLSKYKLINESANELYIDRSLNIKRAEKSLKSTALRITGYKEKQH